MEPTPGYVPTSFANLGDAIDRAGDPDAPAVIDLGASPLPYLQLSGDRRAGRCDGARAPHARPRPRRAHRDPVGQPWRVSHCVSRDHAGRSGRGAGQLEASGSDRRVHLARLRRNARAATARDCRSARPICRVLSSERISRRCSTAAPLPRSRRIRQMQPCFSTLRAPVAGPRVWCCRIRATSGSSTCAATPAAAEKTECWSRRRSTT